MKRTTIHISAAIALLFPRCRTPGQKRASCEKGEGTSIVFTATGTEPRRDSHRRHPLPQRMADGRRAERQF